MLVKDRRSFLYNKTFEQIISSLFGIFWFCETFSNLISPFYSFRRDGSNFEGNHFLFFFSVAKNVCLCSKIKFKIILFLLQKMELNFKALMRTKKFLIFGKMHVKNENI
jgi:hypothetical protein